MSVLLAGDLDSQALMQFLGGQAWPKETLCMVFAEDAFRFEPFQGPADFLLRTEQGRVFCTWGECRWRRLGARMRTVYLGAACNVEKMEDMSEKLQGLTRVEYCLFFWGVRTDLDQEWIEQQVPHRFTFPIATGQYPWGRVRLVLEEWRDGGGMPHFSRFHHLEETKGE